MISELELRIVLLIIAIIVIAAIYIWYRANSKDQIIDHVDLNDVDLDGFDDFSSNHDQDDNTPLPEDLRSEFQGVSKELREETISKRIQAAKQVRAEAVAKKSSTPKVDASTKEMLVIFHVVAREPSQFTGPMIERMMSELQLEYGDMGAYHYNVERLGVRQSVYCVVNMLKPGSFDIGAMQTLSTRGLTLILQLPGPEDSLKAFNIMTEHAQRLATFLNGDILDKDQNPITNQTLSMYKEQVQLFGLRASRQAASA